MSEEIPEIKIAFEPISKRVSLIKGSTIYDLLKSINIRISSICGGAGTCGKCKILVQKGLSYLNEPTKAEKNHISIKDLNTGWRLACQTEVLNNKIDLLKKLSKPQLRIFLPEELILENFIILESVLREKLEKNPTVRKIFLQIKKPELKTPIPDFERLLLSLKSLENINLEKIDINFDVLKTIPYIIRKNDHQITLTLWNDKRIIDIEPGDNSSQLYGMAFDIGTTTIVGYLVNLNNGKICAITSMLNPQTAYGEDLVTRLTFINQNQNGLDLLNDLIINALNKLISENCKKASIKREQIYDTVIVGNSVMHHIFLGLNPKNIAISPFVPAIRRGLNVDAKKLGLRINKGAKVYALPVIAGFVGADTVAVILASNIYNQDDFTLAIDIGTNGEIIVGNKHFLATGSCAAGPALEGAQIKHGMRAAEGAIDSVKIDPKTLEISYTTILNKKPIGICGSGLIDAIAEMVKAKIVLRSGKFNQDLLDNEKFIQNGKDIEFILVKKEESNIGKEITLTQNDIRQIQMAKAAFYSGYRVILKYLKTNQNDLIPELKQILLAGAFGSYIKCENAKFIGMIPDLPDKNIKQIGNAAGIGAQMCLINKNLRKKAEKLIKDIQYVEIATKKEFQKEFALAMYFPHYNLDLFPNLKEYEKIPLR
ncbi:MAG: ASKHA domain-containing protein [Promethearchaeota archaeon]